MEKEFGKRLKNLRKKNHDKQEDLAEILNVTASMISKWENGINFPEVKKLIEIAKYYDVSIDYLCGLEDEAGRKIQNITQTFNFKF